MQRACKRVLAKYGVRCKGRCAVEDRRNSGKRWGAVGADARPCVQTSTHASFTQAEKAPDRVGCKLKNIQFALQVVSSVILCHQRENVSDVNLMQEPQI